MAFQRLVVNRSPLLVWFGALLAVTLYGLMRAEHLTFGSLFTHGRPWLWVPSYALSLYCITRGLTGAWGKDLRIDREAGTLQLVGGTVVELDSLGALSIKNHALHAEGVEPPLYVSRFEYGNSLVHRKLALEDVLLRGGRRRFYRLRRLTFHRSWGLFVFTLLGCTMLTLAVGEHIFVGSSDELEYKLFAIAGYALGFAWFRRALFGSFSKHQLFVDPTAGMLQLETGTSVALADLGALSIVERKPKSTGRRHALSDFDLRAANVETVLFTDFDHERVKRRFDALATAVLESELRRILEAPVVEVGAFRSGLDPIAEAKRIIGVSPYRAAALNALAWDSDATIRDRARSLL